MGAQKKRRTPVSRSPKHIDPVDLPPKQRKWQIMMDFVYRLYENVYESNLTQMVLAAYNSNKLYGQIHYIMKKFELTGSAQDLPRIVNTRHESKLSQVVALVWEQHVEDDDLFPKFTIFLEQVYKEMGTKNVTKKAVKEALRLVGVRVVNAKNVANAENPKSKENRVKNAQYFLETIKRKGIGVANGPRLFFFDSCNFNQLKIDDVQCLSPQKVEVYKPSHHTITTESVTMMLLVDHYGEIHHWELWHTREDGTTDYKRVIEFFEAAGKQDSVKKIKGQKLVYLDNAGSHKKALLSSLEKIPPKATAKVEAEHHAYLPRQNAVKKKWSPIWAPSCTPESNLAEFFFRTLKASVSRALQKTFRTMTGPEWKDFLSGAVTVWLHTRPISSSTLGHIIDYLERVVACEGDLQEEAIRRKQFANREDFINTIKSYLK